ncbi:MAG: DNA gyrase subunit A, partial [Clostridia bacterium]|nr:DNA gyrase subunit A [Clostridia bacterium]
RKEPVVLPTRIPTLLINGSSGIAVGMATNIPPHNLTEVMEGAIAQIDNPDITTEELMEYIKGPDFPTKATIMGLSGIRSAYATGKGKIIVRAKATIEEHKDGSTSIIVTELPYQVNKKMLVESIAQLVKEKKIEGLLDIDDHSSDRVGIRLEIFLKRDANAQVVLNQLYRFTRMQDSFSVNMLAIDNGQPKTLTLKEVLARFISFQEEIVTRRTKYDLDKALARMHILEGLRIALANIDEVISVIRNSYDDAKERLMERFGMSEIQAQSVLEMKLGQLQKLNGEKIDAEYNDLIERTNEYRALLTDKEKLKEQIKKELREIVEKYGDERLTAIEPALDMIEDEDLIEDEEVVVTMTHFGYVKRLASDTYRSQRRGGKGIAAVAKRDEDFVENLFVCRTKDHILFFTNLGRIHHLKAYQLPEAGRHAKGSAIVNLLQLFEGEKVTTMIPVSEFYEDTYLTMLTKRGLVKKTEFIEYKTNRKGGLNAIGLNEGDELINVKVTNGNNQIFVVTHDGKSIRFNETDVRPMGRTAHGVRAIDLADGDYVVGSA